MQSEFAYRGRQVRAAEIQFIRQLIAAHPGLSRRRLSAELCAAWNWVQPNGQPRDMVARSLMLELHRAGHIQLPAKRISSALRANRWRRWPGLQLPDTWDHATASSVGQPRNAEAIFTCWPITLGS